MESRLRSVVLVLVAMAAIFGGASDATALTPTPSPAPTATPTPTPTPSLPQELTPVSVTASTSDGNVPANTIDNNLATRWAGFGDGAWIQFDLGSSQQRFLTHISIAVYRGNERQNRFDLVGSSDGTTWSPLLTGGLTSGTTTLEQTFDVPDRFLRYVRYVGHGSTVGSWNSLTEVSLFTARTAPWCTVTPSTTLAAVGDSVVVQARSNLGIGVWGLSIIDAATGQLQDEANPIFTPARPPQQNGNFTVSWTLVAARPGTVTFRVGVNGEIRDESCGGCFYFTHASGSSVPVTSQDGTITPTPTPTPTNTPTPTPTVPQLSGHYRIMARHSGKAVVVQSASTANNANVFQWTYGGTQTNDEWRIQQVLPATNAFSITNRHSGKVMEVTGSSTANGGDVRQNGWVGQPNQTWEITGLGNGYYRILARHSGKVLNVSNAGTTNGTDVNQWSWTGVTHQQFQLISVP
jgi:hypothetical protein